MATMLAYHTVVILSENSKTVLQFPAEMAPTQRQMQQETVVAKAGSILVDVHNAMKDESESFTLQAGDLGPSAMGVQRIGYFEYWARQTFDKIMDGRISLISATPASPSFVAVADPTPVIEWIKEFYGESPLKAVTDKSTSDGPSCTTSSGHSAVCEGEAVLGASNSVRKRKALDDGRAEDDAEEGRLEGSKRRGEPGRQARLEDGDAGK